MRRADTTDRPAPFDVTLQAGRYVLDARAVGYDGRTDTVVVRSGVTDQITTVLVLDRVRDMASPRVRFGSGLPAGDPSDVRIVGDERVCERARLAP